MRLPHVPGPVRGRRRPGRRRAAVLAFGVAVLAVLAVAAARPAQTAATTRTAAAVTIVRATLPAAAAASWPAAGAVSLPGTGGCGLLDAGCYVSSAITGWFAGLVTSAIGPLLALIGRSALSTPQPDTVPAVRTLWSAGLGIADACYGLLVLIGGIIVMTHETLQTSYSAKEIAPRLVLGFIAANLSMILMTRAVDLANGLSAAFTGGGVNPRSAAAALIVTLGNAVSTHGIFLILLALAGVVLALVLAAVYVLRLMAVVLLAAAAPLCLALYALPQTAWAARWWCRALAAALAVQVAQAMVLTAAVQVFFAPGWLPGDTGSALGQTLITLCLLWILMRIPFWVTRPVLTPFGGSPLRRAARFAITTAVLSRIAPVLSGRQPPHPARGAARPGRGAPPGRGPGRTGESGLAPAHGGPRPVSGPGPGPQAQPRPRHAAPPPLPGGGAARPGRSVIVTDDDNFPTDRYVLAGIAAQHGCELRMIATGLNDGVSEDAVRAAVDERTAVVSLSHVAYRSGALADMAAITQVAHEAGALMLWDLCHSVGAVPVELDASGADLAIGCTYKYVNAGPGAPAFLYVRNELQDAISQPVWGWFGQRDQFAMGPGYDPAPGIEKFLTGTPQIIGTAAVQEGARLLGEAGMGRLRAKGVALTELLIGLADEWLAPHGFTVASPRRSARRGAHVTLHHPDAWQLSQALIKAGVVGDYRTPDRLRLGPAPITTRFTDVWDALDTLRRIAGDGSYAGLAAERGRVT